jgi:SAM-dependent methyltransferase
MRELIRCAEARAGTAETLPLADSSVDAVVAGAAFHWFEVAPFLDEAQRVLRPGGTVGLLWNQRDDRVGWVAELGELAQFPEGGAVASAELGVPFSDERFQPGELLEVPYLQLMDVPLLLDRVSSVSTTITRPAAERADLLARVEVFARDRFGEGSFEFPYLTRAWRHKIRS